MTEPEEGRGRRQLTPLLLLRVAAIAGVLSLLGLLVWSLAHSSEGAGYVKNVEEGKKPSAPAFDLPIIWPHVETWPPALSLRAHDGRISLGELRGQLAVVNFWASWCEPCKEEAPAFRRAAARFSGRVAFVGIDVQDLTSSAQKFLRRYKVNYVSLRDRTNDSYSAYGLTGVPETYFLDRQGRTVRHEIGRVREAELAADISELLKADRR